LVNLKRVANHVAVVGDPFQHVGERFCPLIHRRFSGYWLSGHGVFFVRPLDAATLVPLAIEQELPAIGKNVHAAVEEFRHRPIGVGLRLL
jgi:hypothetical protein